MSKLVYPASAMVAALALALAPAAGAQESAKPAAGSAKPGDGAKAGPAATAKAPAAGKAPAGTKAQADDAKAAPAATTKSPAEGGAPKAKNVVPTDPDNVRGISPYQQKLAEGRRAFVAKDYDGAAAAFEGAIASKPDDPQGYYLLAQVKLFREDATGAAEVLDKARDTKATAAMKAKMLFLRAEVSERVAAATKEDPEAADRDEALKQIWDKPAQAWAAYVEHVKANEGVPDYTASAEARKKAIADRLEREKAYAVVKAKKANR